MGKTSQKRGVAKVAAAGPDELVGSSGGGSLRAAELMWLMQHPDELTQYEGRWVVLEGSGIVCHSYDLVDVVKEARASGISIPFAIRVPAKQEGPVVV